MKNNSEPSGRQMGIIPPVREQLGDKVRIPVIRPDLVDDENIWMIQRGERFRFGLEAPQTVSVVGEIRWQDLQSDFAVEARIHRRKDLTHAAFAEERLNLEWADRYTGAEHAR